MLDSKAEYVTKSQGLEDKSDLITRQCQGLAFSGVDGRVYTEWTFVCWGRCLFYISQARRRQNLGFDIFTSQHDGKGKHGESLMLSSLGFMGWWRDYWKIGYGVGCIAKGSVRVYFACGLCDSNIQFARVGSLLNPTTN